MLENIYIGELLKEDTVSHAMYFQELELWTLILEYYVAFMTPTGHSLLHGLCIINTKCHLKKFK